MLVALNRSLFWFYYIWHCSLTRHWFAQCQQHLYIGVILQYNSGSVTADFEQVSVSIRLFFTWLLRIYITLGKGCHILYVFGLNSTCICLRTRSLMALWWMLTYIIVFYCVCVSKVSCNLQCVLVYDTIFWFNLVFLLSLILIVLSYIWYCYFYSPVVFASYCSKHICDYV